MRLDTAPIYVEPRWRAWCKRIVLRRLFRRFATFHSVGSLTERFLEDLGVRPARIFPFPYAVNNAYFAEKADRFRQERERIRSDLGISAGAFVVLGVLKFVPRENPLELLRGFHLFHEICPDSALLLVGAGALENEIKAYVAASNLTGAVLLVGYARYSELPKWYAVSDVFVHPARRESWGVSVNEAMACGLPVVASSSVGSSYDLVRDGANGYQYPSENVKALAGCLARIASRPDRGVALGECSTRLIQAWDFEATMRSLESAVDMIRSESTHQNIRMKPLLEPAEVERGQQH